jgi:precorrin-6B methylase 2
LFVAARLLTALSKNDSYFSKSGFLNTCRSNLSLDGNNQPIPWFNDAVIAFLDSRLNKTMRVFEYGSGQSTLYLSQKVKSVISIEHSRSWYEDMKSQVPDNAKIVFAKEIGPDYPKQITLFPKKFDIVLIDGRRRVECVKPSIKKLSPRGVLILDDSERVVYQSAFKIMKSHGFRNLDFTSIKLGDFATAQTTVFYRSNNCFEI